MFKNLSIIVLAKNEYETLVEILPEIKKYADDVILVDGHSNDKTKELCDELEINFCLDNKLGKGDAQRVGVSKAKNKFIIFVDGDGAHELGDIKKIYEKLELNDGLVVCSRQTGGSYDLNLNSKFSSVVRVAGVVFLVVLFNKLFKTNLTDVLYSYKGISKSNFEKIKTSQNGFTIEIDILIQSIKKGLIITEIPSRENARKYGISKLPTIEGLYFIYYILKKSLFS
jgi:glycosyltransferase involved in cell wall biosynthesis